MPDNIINAVLTAVVGGLLAFLLEKHKERREDVKDKQKKQEHRFQNRPEISIIDYKNYLSRVGYGIKQKCDIELFVTNIESIDRETSRVKYCEEELNPEGWCCVIYTIKNVGKTDISLLSIACACKKNTCIFSCSDVKDLVSFNALHYLEAYDKKIFVGETLTLKICYYKERIIVPQISATMIISLEDSNGHYWFQSFFAPENKLYDSHEVEAKEYYQNFRINEWAKY